jgi:predicted  nucleic acid-binding Zn-ribbon protein
LGKQLDEALRKFREKEAEFVYRQNESQEAITALKQELHQAKLALDGLTKQLDEVSQRSREQEANFTYRLNEAQAVNTNLQRELYQARLPVYGPPNLYHPHEVHPTRTDVEYIRALGRNYRC